jgi:predicted phage baseplate assembly protein
VTNPLAAGGGQDPQELADARTNAPVTVLTLERVVSIKDFEDFARAYAGIGKALATWTWSADRRGVFLTVAGPDGGAVVDDVLAALKSALVKAGDPHVPVRVATYAAVPFRVAAAVETDPDYAAGTVEAELHDHFGFARRAFGQPVALSEVMAVIQDVPGVVSVDVERLSRGAAAERKALLEASRPAAGAAMELAQPAELLTLDLRPGDIAV